MSVKQSIKVTLSMVNKALKQLPADKRMLLTSRINKTLNTYQSLMESQQSLLKFHKELEFNLNFIKLSHPNLDYTPELQSHEGEREGEGEGEGEGQPSESSTHKIRLKGSDQFEEIERLDNDSFDQQEERERGVREEVMFTNWFEGNADPEMLKRHKQLLERQHFAGEFWEGKEKPKSPTKEYLKSVLSAGPPKQMPEKNRVLKDMKPQKFEEGEEFWETVKR